MPDLTTLPGTIEFANSWAFWLLPLPLLVRLLPPWRASRDAVRAPFFDRLLIASDAQRRRGAMVLISRRGQQVLVTLTWLALVVAAARPQLLGEPIEQQKAGRDLMIAVDLSGSMEATDFTSADGARIDRLAAVKEVLRSLAAARGGDRLGLVVFGNAAYLQAPFTEDHDTWLTLLEETRIRMAGPSTVLGDAIGLAIKLFVDADTAKRVLLLLTDGNDTGSIVPPIDAAKVAATHGIRIYPIAIGDPGSVGEEAIDQRTLDRVAEVTGGRSFAALDRDGLTEVFAVLDALEPSTFDSVAFRPRTDLHWVPVVGIVLLYMLLRALALVIDRPGNAAPRTSGSAG